MDPQKCWPGAPARPDDRRHLRHEALQAVEGAMIREPNRAAKASVLTRSGRAQAASQRA